MKKFNFYNNIIGWLSFAVAAVVYLMTMEPTTSLWDCGEFIASAYKLEVGHPPGAPVFMILARFFSLFAGDTATVAKMINSLSALASAFTILFLFWTISHLARKIIIKNQEYTLKHLVAVFGAALVGAMAYTFSDTFWFSAVEGEVYALSSLFTALVFWAILKWENVANEKNANRWIILIAYLMGLSIGVHLLNLLAIPAIVMVYYYKKYQPVTTKGFLYALLVSVVLLGSLMYGIIPGIVKVASWFELKFVNGLGLGYNSGIAAFAVLLIGSTILSIHLTSTFSGNKTLLAFLFTLSLTLFGIPFLFGHPLLAFFAIAAVFAIVYFIEEKHVVLNTILLGLAVIFIGYSTFAIIVIRSQADPPMDENNPDNVFALLSYLNREQYGDRPLFHGQYYNAPLDKNENGDPVYIQRDGKYVIADYKPDLTYHEDFTTIFPRMYSGDKDHVEQYKEWANIQGREIKYQHKGEVKTAVIPTFAENIRFFVVYQIGHMYLRYFMWNFAGRQNDTQGHGELLKGNWITGINGLDEIRLGSQENLPGYLKNDTSRNKYYLLPFLLGLIGVLYQSQKKPKDFFVVLLLFILTGLAIVVYLNQYPLQPRERDYAYAGSFYAFAIWIGLGVLGVYEMFNKKIRNVVSPLLATIICFALVPVIMASENWDDHDRSGRYTARDFAYNYLNTCAPNAILFTNGDNDTFPLWYAQEVEGIRTDVRIVNLSLFNTDWYVEQMARKAYDGEPVPFTLPEEKYVQGTNDVIFYNELDKLAGQYVDVDDVIDWVKSDNKITKAQASDGSHIDYIPTSKFRLEVDKEKVIANGTVREEDADLVLPAIKWTYKKRYLEKKQMMMLDFLATSNWERPVYYVSPGRDITMGLDNYLQLDGFAYRLVPIKTQRKDFLTIGRIDVDVLYNNLMNKFRWGRMNEPDVNIGFYDKRTVSIIRIRNTFKRLADELVKQNKLDSAINVLDRAIELMPDEKYPFDYYILGIVDSYYGAGAIEKANSLAIEFSEICADNLEYFFSLESRFWNSVDYETQVNMQYLRALYVSAEQFKQTDVHKEIKEKFDNFYDQFVNISQ